MDLNGYTVTQENVFHPWIWQFEPCFTTQLKAPIIFKLADIFRTQVIFSAIDKVQHYILKIIIVTPNFLGLSYELLGLVFCFNVKVSNPVQSLAKRLGISIKQHKVIYKLLEDIKVCKINSVRSSSPLLKSIYLVIH